MLTVLLAFTLFSTSAAFAQGAPPARGGFNSRHC